MEEKNEKQKSNKMLIIIGVLVLLVIAGAILAGYLLQGKTPDKIFETSINKLTDSMLKNLDETMPEIIDFKNHDLSIQGNIGFDTNADLEGFEALKNYNYGFQFDVSFPKKIMKMNLSLNEEEKELLLAKIILQDATGYMDIPGILPSIMDLGPVETTNETELELDQIQISREDYKTLIKETKDMFLSTMDQNKFSSVKDIHKEYNGKEADTTEYIYLLDEENQKRTVKEIITKMIENESYIALLSKMTSLNESEIKSNLESSQEEFAYEEDVKVVLTTTGLVHDLVAVDIISDSSMVRYVDYNEKETLVIDDLTLEFDDKENVDTIHFNYMDYSGDLTIDSKKESDSKFLYTITANVEANGTNFHVNLEMAEDYDATVTKEDVTNAKSEDEFTEEEMQQVYFNFLAKIKGTSLESLLNQFLIGLV